MGDIVPEHISDSSGTASPSGAGGHVQEDDDVDCGSGSRSRGFQGGGGGSPLRSLQRKMVTISADVESDGLLPQSGQGPSQNPPQQQLRPHPHMAWRANLLASQPPSSSRSSGSPRSSQDTSQAPPLHRRPSWKDGMSKGFLASFGPNPQNQVVAPSPRRRLSLVEFAPDKTFPAAPSFSSSWSIRSRPPMKFAGSFTMKGQQATDYVMMIKRAGSEEEEEGSSSTPPAVLNAHSVNNKLFNQSLKKMTHEVTQQIASALNEHDFDEVMKDTSAEGEKTKLEMSRMFESYRKLGVLRKIHATKESVKTEADGPSAPNHTARSLQELHSSVDPESAKKLESRFQRAADEVASHREWLKAFERIPAVDRYVKMDDVESHKYRVEKLQRGRTEKYRRKLDQWEDPFSPKASPLSSPFSLGASPKGTSSRTRRSRRHSTVEVGSAKDRTNEFRSAKMAMMEEQARQGGRRESLKGNKSARF